MKLEQLVKKFNDKFGLEGEVTESGFGEATVTYRLPNGLKIVDINLFETKDGNWKFGGYVESFQDYWNTFCWFSK